MWKNNSINVWKITICEKPIIICIIYMACIYINNVIIAWQLIYEKAVIYNM
jgi:hypothetical protein